MTKVTACPLPAHSLLHERIQDADFIDCYAADGQTSPRKAAETIVTFPAWAKALVILRGIVTRPFGLSQDGPVAEDKLGPFPVETETEDEIIAGFDDKHLNFRVSVLRHEGKMMLATWVRPHNFGGRLYLSVIMPFHILIARNGIARAAKTAAQTT